MDSDIERHQKHTVKRNQISNENHSIFSSVKLEGGSEQKSQEGGRSSVKNSARRSPSVLNGPNSFGVNQPTGKWLLTLSQQHNFWIKRRRFLPQLRFRVFRVRQPVRPSLDDGSEYWKEKVFQKAKEFLPEVLHIQLEVLLRLRPFYAISACNSYFCESP